MYLGWLAKRLVMLAYDIFVVNISYYLALVIRFWVNNNFRPIANNVYIPAYENFTPYYTILTIIVFIVFQLYSSKWKFAGLNDLNRILSANIVTAIIHVLGTILFVQRMPITYYCIGAFIQAPIFPKINAKQGFSRFAKRDFGRCPKNLPTFEKVGSKLLIWLAGYSLKTFLRSNSFSTY